MKVAFLNTDDFTGGAAIASLRLAKTLIEKGNDVTYFTAIKKSENEFVEPILSSIYFKWRYKLNFILERLSYWKERKDKNVAFAFSPANFGFDVTKYINFKSFDIIHIHWTNFGFLSISSLEKLFKLEIPIVFTLHDMWLFTGGCHHSGDCTNFINNCGNCLQYLKHPSMNDFSYKVHAQKLKLFNSAENIKIIGCSNWISERAKKSSLLNRFEIQNIPNPIDLEVFTKLDNLNSIKEKLGLSLNKKYIIISAMKVSVIWKGFSFLEAALIKLAKMTNNNELELLVMGAANFEDFINIPIKCHFLGVLSDAELINEYYNCADVMVNSSIQENLPNTIMESMATGTPCVGFNIGGIPEMIVHQKTGYLAKYKSTVDLALGIEWTINRSNLPELSANCIEKVRREYDKEIIADKYISLYQQTIASKIL